MAEPGCEPGGRRFERRLATRADRRGREAAPRRRSRRSHPSGRANFEMVYSGHMVNTLSGVNGEGPGSTRSLLGLNCSPAASTMLGPGVRRPCRIRRNGSQ